MTSRGLQSARHIAWEVILVLGATPGCGARHRLKHGAAEACSLASEAAVRRIRAPNASQGLIQEIAMRDRDHNRFFLAGIGVAIVLAAWTVGQARPDREDSVDQRIAKLNGAWAHSRRRSAFDTASAAEKSVTRRLETLEGAVRDFVKAAGRAPGTLVRGDLHNWSERSASRSGRRRNWAAGSRRWKAQCARLRILRPAVCRVAYPSPPGGERRKEGGV